MVYYQYLKRVKIGFIYAGEILTVYNVKWLDHKLNVFAIIVLNNINILIHKAKNHIVKHQNVNVNVMIIYLHMGQMILNVFVNILINNMIYKISSVQDRIVIIVKVLQVLGHVLVVLNLLTILLLFKHINKENQKEKLLMIC